MQRKSEQEKITYKSIMVEAATIQLLINLNESNGDNKNLRLIEKNGELIQAFTDQTTAFLLKKTNLRSKKDRSNFLAALVIVLDINSKYLSWHTGANLPLKSFDQLRALNQLLDASMIMPCDPVICYVFCLFNLAVQENNLELIHAGIKQIKHLENISKQFIDYDAIYAQGHIFAFCIIYHGHKDRELRDQLLNQTYDSMKLIVKEKILDGKNIFFHFIQQFFPKKLASKEDEFDNFRATLSFCLVVDKFGLYVADTRARKLKLAMGSIDFNFLKEIALQRIELEMLFFSKNEQALADKIARLRSNYELMIDFYSLHKALPSHARVLDYNFWLCHTYLLYLIRINGSVLLAKETYQKLMELKAYSPDQIIFKVQAYNFFNTKLAATPGTPEKTLRFYKKELACLAQHPYELSEVTALFALESLRFLPKKIEDVSSDQLRFYEAYGSLAVKEQSPLPHAGICLITSVLRANPQIDFLSASFLLEEQKEALIGLIEPALREKPFGLFVKEVNHQFNAWKDECEKLYEALARSGIYQDRSRAIDALTLGIQQFEKHHFPGTYIANLYLALADLQEDTAAATPYLIGAVENLLRMLEEEEAKLGHEFFSVLQQSIRDMLQVLNNQNQETYCPGSLLEAINILLTTPSNALALPFVKTLSHIAFWHACPVTSAIETQIYQTYHQAIYNHLTDAPIEHHLLHEHYLMEFAKRQSHLNEPLGSEIHFFAPGPFRRYGKDSTSQNKESILKTAIALFPNERDFYHLLNAEHERHFQRLQQDFEGIMVSLGLQFSQFDLLLLKKVRNEYLAYPLLEQLLERLQKQRGELDVLIEEGLCLFNPSSTLGSASDRGEGREAENRQMAQSLVHQIFANMQAFAKTFEQFLNLDKIYRQEALARAKLDASERKVDEKKQNLENACKRKQEAQLKVPNQTLSVEVYKEKESRAESSLLSAREDEESAKRARANKKKGFTSRERKAEEVIKQAKRQELFVSQWLGKVVSRRERTLANLKTKGRAKNEALALLSRAELQLALKKQALAQHRACCERLSEELGRAKAEEFQLELALKQEIFRQPGASFESLSEALTRVKAKESQKSRDFIKAFLCTGEGLHLDDTYLSELLNLQNDLPEGVSVIIKGSFLRRMLALYFFFKEFEQGNIELSVLNGISKYLVNDLDLVLNLSDVRNFNYYKILEKAGFNLNPGKYFIAASKSLGHFSIDLTVITSKKYKSFPVMPLMEASASFKFHSKRDIHAPAGDKTLCIDFGEGMIEFCMHIPETLETKIREASLFQQFHVYEPNNNFSDYCRILSDNACKARMANPDSNLNLLENIESPLFVKLTKLFIDQLQAGNEKPYLEISEFFKAPALEGARGFIRNFARCLFSAFYAVRANSRLGNDNDNGLLFIANCLQRFNKVLDSLQNGETFDKKILKEITAKTLKEMTRPLQHPHYAGFFTQQTTVNDSSAREVLPEAGPQ